MTLSRRQQVHVGADPPRPWNRWGLSICCRIVCRRPGHGSLGAVATRSSATDIQSCEAFCPASFLALQQHHGGGQCWLGSQHTAMRVPVLSYCCRTFSARATPVPPSMAVWVRYCPAHGPENLLVITFYFVLPFFKFCICIK